MGDENCALTLHKCQNMAENTSKSQHPQKAPEKKEKEAPPVVLPPPSQKDVFQKLKPDIETAHIPPPPPQTMRTTLEEDFDIDTPLLTPEEERALHEQQEHHEKRTNTDKSAVQKAPTHADVSAGAKEHASQSSAPKSAPRFTRRQVFGWIISVVILMGILWAAWWSLSVVWRFFQGTGDSDTPPQTVVSDTPEVSVTPTPSEDLPDGWIHPSVYSSVLLGTLPYTFEGTTGVSTAIAIGITTDTITTDLEEGLALIKKVSAALHTDVRQMLDDASVRTKALDDYIALLTDYRSRIVQLQEDLQADMGELQTSFEGHTTDKTSAEETFFIAFDIYDAVSAQTSLDTFITAQQKAGKEKAYYKAFVLLNNLYDTALSTLDLRLTDLQSNRAALIEGVQVVDIQGSNLNLILSEEDLSQ